MQYKCLVWFLLLHLETSTSSISDNRVFANLGFMVPAPYHFCSPVSFTTTHSIAGHPVTYISFQLFTVFSLRCFLQDISSKRLECGGSHVMNHSQWLSPLPS